MNKMAQKQRAYDGKNKQKRKNRKHAYPIELKPSEIKEKKNI